MANLNLIILVAIRTVEHSPYTLSGASPQASLFAAGDPRAKQLFKEVGFAKDGYTDENYITIIVCGIPPSTDKDAVINYFENSRRSGGGEVSSIVFTDEGDATITFLAVKGMCDSASWLSVYVKSVCYVLSKRITIVFTPKRLSKSKHSLQ